MTAIGRGPTALAVVRHGADLARGFQCKWDAVHVVTPDAADRDSDFDAAEALACAAEMGASVARIPAASVAEGLMSHLNDTGTTDVVIGTHPATSWQAFFRSSLIVDLTQRGSGVRFHLVPSMTSPVRDRGKGAGPSGGGPAYGKAVGFSAATAVLAMLLSRWLSSGALNLLFLFPVIGASVWYGTRPGLAAAAAAVILTNLLIVEPHFAMRWNAPQTWVLAVVLGLVAAHTGAVTAELRRRVTLSDRNARENARLAGFALELTRVSDWQRTADLVSLEISALMGGLHSALFREVQGQLTLMASHPAGAVFSPVDTTALEWAWDRGEEAGNGTKVLAGANWQFHPLKTSLGTMAVLGLAREDGRDPVRADQAVLLSTLLAQAALAHERLRLEDQMREAAIPCGTVGSVS